MNFNFTMIGQAFSFALFVIICMKYVWPRLSSVLQERQDKIAEGLKAAEAGEKSLAESAVQAEQQLAQAKAEGAQIIEQAERRGQQIVEDAKQQAVVEADRVKASAHAEIEQEIRRVREQLRRDVSKLALAGAERILEKSIDEKVHQEMLSKLAAQL